MSDVSETATGKVHRPGLITGRGSGLLSLSCKLFVLPISIIGSIAGLITGSIRLGFWIAGGVLSYSLTMIGLTTSERHRQSPPEAIDLSSEFENLSNPESPSSPPVSISESATASEAIDFLSEFETQYGKMHPDFVPESFTDAVQRSRREFKLLLVYLHAPDHPDTPSFCKETLCSDVVSGFVNENFVAWGDSVAANGGLKMSKSLNASRFPFWAVIMAATGQSISLLRQFEGPASPEEMLEQMQSVLEESTSSLNAARLDSNDHTKNTQSNKQDAACHAELESDQAIEDQNQVDKEAESAALCEEKALSLGPEPEKGPDVTQVLVRLPNGERKGRRFHCSATLRSVYDFVDSSGCLEVGSYTLVTFFPRVLYGEDELSSTIEELGLYPQASLFVELKT
ncbi:hypothetical protein R6Q59_004000 [Mikania micrantha]|uniref:UBX domain-containing protein n=1 Tax=Mikania micrantha TaxID=192012 RepID=A0A5N6MMF4_9ASTR|nr:hypothetical protein E3N88_30644 [Mikania micrantha]